MLKASSDGFLNAKESTAFRDLRTFESLNAVDSSVLSIIKFLLTCTVRTAFSIIWALFACRWMISSPGIQDLNLDHNLIGDGGARELLQGLVLRKEAGLPVMKLTVTVYISQDTFEKIVEYSTPKKKRRKGKGKKVSFV